MFFDYRPDLLEEVDKIVKINITNYRKKKEQEKRKRKNKIKIIILE